MRFNRLESIASSVVQSTLASLPAEIRAAAAACLIEMVEMAAVMEVEEDLEPDILGLFEGCTRADPPGRTGRNAAHPAVSR